MLKYTMACSLLAASLFAAPALAGGKHGHKHKHDHDHGHEKTTQLDAHEHGHGKFNIAISGKTLAMELEIPSADIVGFEHAAKTKAQKAKLKAAKAQLGKPLELFIPTAAAGCKLAKAEIEVEGAQAHDDHGHGHKHAKKHDHGHKHGHSDEGESHSEFHAQYELTCANPDKLTGIEFAFFKKFPNSEELDVSMVGDKGTKSFEASASKASFSVGAGS